MSTVKMSALLVAVAALLGACSTPVAPPVETAKPVAVAPPTLKPAPTPPAIPQPAVTPPLASTSLPAYLDPNNPIAKERSVYFAFDDDRLESQYLTLIDKHGQFLATNPKVAIKIEGNADERGSSEYNLALGQRRAEAVAKALKLLGVKDSQMEAVSWGKEKPRASGHDEQAWAQNRRADLQYPSK